MERSHIKLIIDMAFNYVLAHNKIITKYLMNDKLYTGWIAHRK